MTTPTKTAAKKATAPEVVPEDNAGPEIDKRIPSVLFENPIFKEFIERYLETFDKISQYNKEVLAEKDDEWNPVKVITKAREFASPENADDADVAIKAALDEYERLQTAERQARKNVLELTAKKLGISLSNTAERNPETEGPLKENRKIAIEIGTNLSTIAKMTSNEEVTSAVNSFLEEYGMPAIGRDQVRTFGNDGKSTPKYRTKVTVTNKDGVVLLEEDGFAKTAMALTKPVFGYERGKALKSDTLREVWEKALAENKDVTTTSFEDNGLTYTITKK